MCQNIVSRSEIVGSFLRPEALKVARDAYQKGEISLSDLKKIEDQTITELVAKQKDVGLTYVSDGEFRRSYWHLDFFWGLNGVEHTVKEQGYLFQGEETRPDSAWLVDQIRYNPNHPVFEEFTFLTQLVDAKHIRQSIPAPAQLYAELVREDNAAKIDRYYADHEALYEDIIQAYRETILQLYALGCRHLKLDDCTWGFFVDTSYAEILNLDQSALDALQQVYLRLNNGAIADLPEDLIVTTHVCRGNYHSTWAMAGGYEPVGNTLLANEHVDAFFLEFDDERAGDFEPLRFLPEGKKVVLGLVTSKSGELEEKESIISRIHEASQYVPLEQIYLSPQCGFASTEEGNILTEEAQWQKIQLINDITETVWGQTSK